MFKAGLVAPCGLDCNICSQALISSDPCQGCNGPDDHKPEFCAKFCGIILCQKRRENVKAGSWYEAAVNWAAANDIVNGYNEDTFAPTDIFTREQMATILYRYSRFKGKDVSQTADLSNFTDAGSVSDWAKDAMAWVVEVKLIARIKLLRFVVF